MTAFLNSIYIAALTTFLSFLIGLPLAVFITKVDVPLKKYLKYLYIIPIFIPPSLITVSWLTIFGSMRWLYGIFGTSLVLTCCYFPFGTLLSITGISNVGKDMEEAAEMNYGYPEVLRRVTLPYASRYIITGFLFVFVFALSNYEVPALLGVRVLPVEIFEQFSSFYNVKAAFFMSLPLIAITSFLILLVAKVMMGSDYIGIGADWRKQEVFHVKRKVKLAGLSYISLIYIFTIIFPVAVLVWKAGRISSYIRAFQNSASEIFYTLILASAGALIIVFLSFFIAYYLRKKRTFLRNLVYYLTILPFAIPATIIGLGLIYVFNRPALNFIYTSPLILLIGYIIRFSPFAIRILEANLSHMDRSLEEASIIAGAGLMKRLFSILVPLSQKALIGAWAICFALIMGELALTIMVIPPGGSTLILKIYTLMHYGSGRLVSALCIISIVAISLPALIVFLIGEKKDSLKGTGKALVIVSICVTLLLMSIFPAIAQETNSHIYSTCDVIEMDTCASAWLIKRFVDKEAVFKFYPKEEFIEEGTPFDTPDAEFRRTHNMSTFETILQKYNIKDPKLIKIGKIIHDIEINYWAGKLEPESEKINRDILNIIKNSKIPEESFKKSFTYFDNLYFSL